MLNDIYLFFIRNDIGIYIVCAFGLFWYGSQFFRARSALQRAVFGLERESGTRLRNSAAGFVFIFIAVIGVVFFVNSQIAPTLPPELLQPPTATPNIFSTRLASPTPLGTSIAPAPTATFPLVPTVTLPGNEIAEAQSNQIVAEESEGETAVSSTTTPLPIVTPAVDCTPNLNITAPRDGAVVSGLVTFNGIADTPNFQYYKLEANGPQTNGQWASLLGRNIEQPITEDSFLGQANLSEWGGGPYLIRLTAVDLADQDTNICVIQITLN